MDYFVYVLQSKKDGKLYVGMTKNLQHRVQEHNSGRVTSTKTRIPFEIIFFERVRDRQQARIREKYWKSGAGREKIRRKATR